MQRQTPRCHAQPSRATPRQAQPYPAEPCRAEPLHAPPSRATPRRAAPRPATPCRAPPRPAPPCPAPPRRAQPRRAEPRPAPPRRATPRRAAPRHATPCRAAPRRATPCLAPPRPAQPRLAMPSRSSRRLRQLDLLFSPPRDPITPVRPLRRRSKIAEPHALARVVNDLPEQLDVQNARIEFNLEFELPIMKHRPIREDAPPGRRDANRANVNRPRLAMLDRQLHLSHRDATVEH